MVSGGGARNESYLPVKGGLFESPSRIPLLFENASSVSFSFDPARLVKSHRLGLVETLVTADLGAPERAAAKIKTQHPTGSIEIPPFSLIRIVWDENLG